MITTHLAVLCWTTPKDRATCPGHFIHHDIACRGNPDQLVQFHLHRLRIAILRALNQEYHQKCDDAGSAVDHQLPRVGIVVNRSSSRPDDHHQQAKAERRRRPRPCPQLHSHTLEKVSDSQSALHLTAEHYATQMPCSAEVAADRKEESNWRPRAGGVGQNYASVKLKSEEPYKKGESKNSILTPSLCD